MECQAIGSDLPKSGFNHPDQNSKFNWYGEFELVENQQKSRFLYSTWHLKESKKLSKNIWFLAFLCTHTHTHTLEANRPCLVFCNRKDVSLRVSCQNGGRDLLLVSHSSRGVALLQTIVRKYHVVTWTDATSHLSQRLQGYHQLELYHNQRFVFLRPHFLGVSLTQKRRLLVLYSPCFFVRVNKINWANIFPGGSFNQPIWKFYDRQIGSFLQGRMKIWKKIETTTYFITHDPFEARFSFHSEKRDPGNTVFMITEFDQTFLPISHRKRNAWI